MSKAVTQRLKYLGADFIAANLAILLFDIARFFVLTEKTVGYPSLKVFLLSPTIMWEQALIPLILLSISALSGYYNRPLLKSRLQEFISTILVAVLQTIIVYLALLTNQETSLRATNYAMLAYLFSMLAGFTYIGRYIITATAFHRFRTGKWKYNILVLGPEKAAHATAENIKLNAHRTGFTLAKVINLSADGEVPTTHLAEICKQNRIKEILFTTSGLSEDKILQILYRLIPLGYPVKMATDTLTVLNSNIRLQSIYEEPYIDVSTANVSDATKNIKRCTDICISFLVLTVLALPIAVMALIVKFTSPGGAFFKQERIGRRQKPFKIYKFRSMRVDAEATGPQLSSENDPRVTPVGAWMRKYRIDEIPQFWNVLKGDMAIVGPRPERRHFINKIMEVAPYYSLVHQVRPGITSWGMVKYGYASDIEQMVERLRYDLIYLANISLVNDLKIIIYTVKTVIKGRGM